jgi:hypothetical protein
MIWVGKLYDEVPYMHAGRGRGRGKASPNVKGEGRLKARVAGEVAAQKGDRGAARRGNQGMGNAAKVSARMPGPNRETFITATIPSPPLFPSASDPEPREPWTAEPQ